MQKKMDEMDKQRLMTDALVRDQTRLLSDSMESKSLIRSIRESMIGTYHA